MIRPFPDLLHTPCQSDPDQSSNCGLTKAQDTIHERRNRGRHFRYKQDNYQSNGGHLTIIGDAQKHT